MEKVIFSDGTPIVDHILTGDDISVPVRPVPLKKWKASFSSVGASPFVNPAKFGIVNGLGTGQTVAQSAGDLVITAGTTANAETIVRSNISFSGSFNLKYQTILSQRIANNNFFVEAVDVIGDRLPLVINSTTSITVTFPSGTIPFGAEHIGQFMYLGAFTGTAGQISGRYAISAVSGDTVTYTVSGFPASGSGTCSIFGWNYYHVLYSGTTATSALFDCQRYGWNTGDTTVTINTSASPGHMGIITQEDGSVTYQDQLVASSTSKQATLRGSRVINVPEEETLVIQLRCTNGTSAPATSTTWTIGFVSVEEYAPQTVSITNIKPQPLQATLPVAIQGTTSVSSITTSIVPGTAATNLGKAEDAAHASGDTGVFMLGVRYETQGTAPNAANDYSLIQVDDLGKLVCMPYGPPVNQVQGVTAAITNTADTAVIASGGAGVRNYVTGVTLVNSSATATVVELKDGSTVIWRGYAPANGTSSAQFLTPLKGTAATAINAACLTTATNTYVTCVGFRGL